MPADLPSQAQPAHALFQTAAPLPAGTPALYAALSDPPGPPLSQADTLALLQALLQAYGELQGRVRELELTDRLRSARLPPSALGIDC